MGNNLFLGIPVGAFYCFLFIIFCFFNTQRSRAVIYFRLVLCSCLLWEGGTILMRLQVRPGIHFWFQISMLGLLLVPIFMYFFLFQKLEINRDIFLTVCGVISCAVVAFNAATDLVLPAPRAVVNEKNILSYTYHMIPGTWILVFAEVALLTYTTVISYIHIGKNKKLQNELSPLFYGTLVVLIGQVVEMLPNVTIPFGSLAGVIMAGGLVFILVRQCLFDLSNRLIIGCVYTLLLVFVFVPLWMVSKNVEEIMEWLNVPLSNLLFGIAAVFTVWAFLLFRLAQNIINSMVLTDRKRQHNSFSEFQTTVTSVLDEKELFRVAAESLCQMIPKGRVLVFLRKEEAEEFALFELTEEDYGLEPEKEQEILQYFHEEDFEKHVEMAPLQYDHTMQGFIYILLPDKVKLNYVEVEYLQQIAAHSSVCLKNIHLYQTAYQNSIHDELTGLYNRRYYKEFIEKYWMPHEPQAIVYIDMDDFRLLNEVYGEDRADEVVCWCADIIREETESKGAIFRFGSNEFLIYFRYQKEEELRMVAQKIQKRLADDKERKPDVLQPVTVSIGIAMYPDTAQDADSLLKQAERATFFAKEDGKNCFRVYKMEEKRASVTEEGKAYQQIAQTIYALVAAIDAKDSFTFEHSVHVSEYAVLLAQAIGLDDSEVRIVQEAGMLHDIGKIGIPDDILKKPGRLTKEEYETMKTHVMNSIDMIHYLPNMNYVIPAVISHHERYDGKGYPRGLAGEDIPLLGRVLAVCDCYDAMVSKRAYKESMSKEYAASELEANKGIQFDPKLADAFITLIKEGKV